MSKSKRKRKKADREVCYICKRKLPPSAFLDRPEAGIEPEAVRVETPEGRLPVCTHHRGMSQVRKHYGTGEGER